MKFKILTILIILFPIVLFGQGNYAEIWYFGNKAGIDFRTNPPTPLLDGQMNVSEGCATLADQNGNLIAYSDGFKIWNKNHAVMPNGILYGGGSPFQAAVFIPYPNHPNQYFLFTCMGGDGTGIEALRYNLIDATLDNGNGDVVAGMKDIVLHTQASEQLTVISNDCGSIYWVVAFVLDDDDWTKSHLKIYRVDENGVNPTPTTFPLNIQTMITNELKFTPDGKHLFWVNADNNYLFGLADFDVETGVLSNRGAIGNGTSFYDIDWFEFSPDSRYIYKHDGKDIYQFDITSPTNNAILASQIKVGNSNFYGKAQMQLAPDGKIYIVNTNKTYLSVIREPNKKGVACNFVDVGFDLDGRKAEMGLPAFCQSFLADRKIIAGDTCELTQTFRLTGVKEFSSIDWDFGDSQTVTDDTLVQHTYANYGNFMVNATITTTCGTYEISKEIKLTNCNFQFEANSLCVGEITQFQIQNTANIQSVLWNFGDGHTSTELEPTHTYAAAGTYTVTLEVTFTDSSTQTITKDIEIFEKPLKPIIEHE